MAVQIKFRLTDEENEHLEVVASEAGTTSANYAKQLLLNSLQSGEVVPITNEVVPNEAPKVVPTQISGTNAESGTKLPFADLCPNGTPESVISEIAESLVKRSNSANNTEKVNILNPYRRIQLACNYYYHGLNLTPVKGLKA